MCLYPHVRLASAELSACAFDLCPLKLAYVSHDPARLPVSRQSRQAGIWVTQMTEWQLLSALAAGLLCDWLNPSSSSAHWLIVCGAVLTGTPSTQPETWACPSKAVHTSATRTSWSLAAARATGGQIAVVSLTTHKWCTWGQIVMACLPHTETGTGTGSGGQISSVSLTTRSCWY